MQVSLKITNRCGQWHPEISARAGRGDSSHDESRQNIQSSIAGA
jgi:hypothetical protein